MIKTTSKPAERRIWAGLFGLALCFIWLLQAPDLSAHQQKVALTEVLVNPRTGNVEVSHRFFLHDGEHAVRLLNGADADILQSEETQAAFARHIADQFQFSDIEGTPLALAYLGYEIERSFFWVYQEIPRTDVPQTVLLHQRALHAIWPEQRNLINVSAGGQVQSFDFVGGSAAQQAHLGP